MPSKQISFKPKKHNLIMLFKALMHLKSLTPSNMTFCDVELLAGMKWMG